MSRQVDSTETGSRSTVVKGEEVNRGVTANKYTVSSGDDDDVLKLRSGKSYSTLLI